MTGEPIFDLRGKRVWVAGHRGMVGSAIVRRLATENCDILTVGRERVDLTRQDQTENWMAAEKPDVVVIAAAKVGGIHANNTLPADFIATNLSIVVNIIPTAFNLGVKKLVLLGSSCIYPRLSPQPMSEDLLLTGPLEPTNEAYAVAKIAGIKLGQSYRKQHGCDFISVMPTNLYGQGDNFDLESSHVLPALLRKIHEAKIAGAPSVEIWGSGKPMREFMYVDDMADATVHLMKHYSDFDHVNVGTGQDVTIRELAETIAKVVGYRGEFHYNASRPDGMPRKLLNVNLLKSLGWEARTTLEEGITKTYDWYLGHVKAA